MIIYLVPNVIEISSKKAKVGPKCLKPADDILVAIAVRFDSFQGI